MPPTTGEPAGPLVNFASTGSIALSQGRPSRIVQSRSPPRVTCRGATERSELARELQPRVIRRTADETESEVVGVLPGHLADQGPGQAPLGGKGQGAVGEGRLACDVHRWLARAGGGPTE